MTNSQIIFNESLELMKQGIIGSTGRQLIYEREDGTKESVPEPEPIHTFVMWKSLGYEVKKGQKAIAKFAIWKHKSAGRRKNRKTGEEVETEEKLFLTDAYFFRKDQVEPIMG